MANEDDAVGNERVGGSDRGAADAVLLRDATLAEESTSSDVPRPVVTITAPSNGTSLSDAVFDDDTISTEYTAPGEELPESPDASGPSSALADDLPAAARRLGIGDNRMQALMRSVLDVVPWEDALDAMTERARELNHAEAMLEMLELRGERAKPLIERRSGAALSTDEAGRLLGKSAETVRTWIAQDKLVGYHAAGDRTRIRLPLWQFRADQRVHEWVQPLVAAFGSNGWAVLEFVTAPRVELGGVSYLNWLLNGRDADVIAAARRTNPE